MTEVQLITYNPGHFHAALVQKEMYPQVARRVHVYGPLGADLLAHVQRIAGFNQRSQQPTAWELEIHAGPNYRAQFMAERPGNVVVLAGFNAAKIDAIHDALSAGMHVLADKPWILHPEQFPRLRQALELTQARGLIAYDIMTERHEITSLLQRDLVQAPAIFGEMVPGTLGDPGVFMESVHYLKKNVAGQPLLRPPWFFDIDQQGNGLTDVGTHLVDLVDWMLYPGQGLDYQGDVQLLAGRRWSTILSRADFQAVTGAAAFPPFLRPWVRDERLLYEVNTSVSYALRGIHVTLNAIWDYEAAPGAGDTHLAVFQGSRALVEVRQSAEENYRPEVYVVPRQAADREEVRSALARQVATWQSSYPGMGLVDLGQCFRLSIPEALRVGHEAHFSQVTRQFLRYVRQEESLPSWEKANMFVKYYVTTHGAALSRQP